MTLFSPSAWCKIFLVCILGLFAVPISAQDDGERLFKDAKGEVLVVTFARASAAPAPAEFGAALERSILAALSEAGMDSAPVRVIEIPEATGDGAARAMLALPVETQDALGAWIDLRLARAASATPPSAAVFHYAFGGLPKTRVQSPDYSFKFASDSALLAIGLHKASLDGATRGLGGLELTPAADAPALPYRLVSKWVRLTFDEGAVGTGDLGTVLGRVFAEFHADEGSYAMGVLSDRGRARAPVGTCRIELYPHIHLDRELDSDEEAERRRAMRRLIAAVEPFASGLYYFDGLDPLTPYSYKVINPTASALRREADSGGFLTASIGGVVRTVAVALEAKTSPEADRSARPYAPPDETVMLDVVIEGATVFDGTRDRPRFVADVGVLGDRIAALGDLRERKRARSIQGKGLYLMPGFVDIHSHADFNVLKVADAPSHIRQGITTVLGGNCGTSPLRMGTYLREVEEHGTPVNLGMLIGNRPIRHHVLGQRKGMFPYAELYRQKELMDLAMEEGAFGMSTGLIYRISEEAFAWELAEICKQMKPYGGFYATHLRGETDEALDAVREAIHIADLGEVALQVSHMKVLRKRNFGRMADYVGYMKAARARGMDVTGDLYPWITSGPAADTNLYRLIVREAIENDFPEVVLFKDLPGRYAPYSGRLLSELLEAEGMTPEELLADLELTSDSKMTGTFISIGEEDIETAIREEFVMICTDASLASSEDLARGRMTDDHPRKFRSYPEFLSKYVRDRQVVSWEQGVHQCTGLPAWRMRLEDRGTIRVGNYADLVLLDPERLGPGTDFRDQTKKPIGIQWVFLNGRIVLDNGEMPEERAGRALYAYGNTKP